MIPCCAAGRRRRNTQQVSMCTNSLSLFDSNSHTHTRPIILILNRTQTDPPVRTNVRLSFLPCAESRFPAAPQRVRPFEEVERGRKCDLRARSIQREGATFRSLFTAPRIPSGSPVLAPRQWDNSFSDYPIHETYVLSLSLSLLFDTFFFYFRSSHIIPVPLLFRSV